MATKAATPSSNITEIAKRRALKSTPAKRTPPKKTAAAVPKKTPSTPAEIPAETAAAQQSQYDPAFPLADVIPHPDNPRHNAIADDELMGSIKEQGLLHDLLVAPHPDQPGKAFLVDGHRRYDAMARLGFTYAPVKWRLDLVDRGDQVAAMLGTTRREGLTPIEEAESFDLLTELGWTVDRISDKSGRSKTTVTERRKLTRLKERAKGAVDAGELTIDDAIRVSKLPASEQSRLEGYVGGSDFRLELGRTEDRMHRQREVDDETKALRDRGIPELEQPKDANYEHSLTYTQHSMTRLSTTGKPNADDHQGCLAFVRARPLPHPTVWYVCTDPGKHDAELSADQAARAKERAEAEAARDAANQAVRAEREKFDESQRVARLLRADTILAAIKPKATLDPILENLVRTTMPALLYSVSDYLDPALFFELIDIPKEKTTGPAGTEAWLEDLEHFSAPAVLKMLAALLIAQGEDSVSRAHDDVRLGHDPDKLDRRTLDAYFATLEAAGHELNSADNELLAAVRGDQDNAAEATA
jgi:ParB/RepB/Spo0J family partition protein